MAFWIFKCNPDKYRLEDRLADPNPTITWTVTRYRDEIQAGDTVFLWVTGAGRGIRAVMQIAAPPRLMHENESELVYWVGQDTEKEYRVVGALTRRDVQIPHAELRETKGLEKLSVFTGFQQATNFPVTAAEGKILLNLIGTENKV